MMGEGLSLPPPSHRTGSPGPGGEAGAWGLQRPSRCRIPSCCLAQRYHASRNLNLECCRCHFQRAGESAFPFFIGVNVSALKVYSWGAPYGALKFPI